MIKKFENFNSDIDPYGEEEWGEPETIESGDIVICIDNSPGSGMGRRLKLGLDYLVVDSNDTHVTLKDMSGWYMKKRFKKLNDD